MVLLLRDRLGIPRLCFEQLGTPQKGRTHGVSERTVRARPLADRAPRLVAHRALNLGSCGRGGLAADAAPAAVVGGAVDACVAVCFLL